MSHNTDFNKYLLVEYQNIAKAHFNTIAAISSFFRYYLLIASIPVTLVSALIALSEKENHLYVLSEIDPMLPWIFLIVSVVGFSVMLYIINLRMDVLLYARTVNAIRKHFYDSSTIDMADKLRTRVLPQSPSMPAYFEGSFFLPVVVSFAVLNTGYFILALHQLGASDFLGSLALELARANIVNLTRLKEIPILVWPSIFVAGVVIHIVAYWAYSRYREHQYLKSNILGVDIDGVLNRHRDHFCNLLKEIVGKTVDPNEITSIPVHENLTLDISRGDANLVFNDPRYWTEMPGLDGASEALRRLRGLLRLKVHVFSHRDWPVRDESEIAAGARMPRKELSEEWTTAASRELDSVTLLERHRLVSAIRSSLSKIRLRYGRGCLALRPIDAITKCWLSKNHIGYDQLTIERGSEYVSDPRGMHRNRFYISRKQRIRFFVEDETEKASKLAYICDVVFLLEQPYNCARYFADHLPDNVKRVKSWDEIYKIIRRLS